MSIIDLYGGFMDKENKVIKILWIVSIVCLILGSIFIDISTKTSVYPTSEYWVAKGYHHVYENYSGEIVNYIEKNERCEIKDDEIIVKEYSQPLNGIGWVLVVPSGILLAFLIMEGFGILGKLLGYS